MKLFASLYAHIKLASIITLFRMEKKLVTMTFRLLGEKASSNVEKALEEVAEAVDNQVAVLVDEIRIRQ